MPLFHTVFTAMRVTFQVGLKMWFQLSNVNFFCEIRLTKSRKPRNPQNPQSAVNMRNSPAGFSAVCEICCLNVAIPPAHTNTIEPNVVSFHCTVTVCHVSWFQFLSLLVWRSISWNSTFRQRIRRNCTGLRCVRPIGRWIAHFYCILWVSYIS